MKFCPECGGRVGDEFNACPACGKNLEQAKIVSRLNVTRAQVARPVQKAIGEQASTMATGVVTDKASTAYGMSKSSSIWGGTSATGAAPPPPAPKSRSSRGTREIGADDEVALAGAASGAEAYTCYRCGSALRYIAEYQRWYCDSCYSYV